METHRSQSTRSVRRACSVFFDVWNGDIFLLCEKLLTESYWYSYVLVIPILKLIGAQGYISDRHRYQFKTILHLRM